MHHLVFRVPSNSIPFPSDLNKPCNSLYLQLELICFLLLSHAGSNFRQPALSTTSREGHSEQPGSQGHQNCIGEPHLGSMDLYPLEEDCTQQTHRKDQVSLLQDWQRQEAAFCRELQLHRGQESLLGSFKSFSFLCVTRAQRSHLHVPDFTLPSGTKRW